MEVAAVGVRSLKHVSQPMTVCLHQLCLAHIYLPAVLNTSVTFTSFDTFGFDTSALSCREEAALSRLNDSDKMWAMLKRIAQQECADGANPPPDSVLLQFLSLAPRVSSLNAAVKAALGEPIAETPSMQGTTAAVG